MFKCRRKGGSRTHEIAAIEAWVKTGAPWPDAGESAPTAAPAAESKGPLFTPEQKAFWAFQPVRDLAQPAVRDSTRVANPIDAFVLAKLEEKNLRPVDPADNRTLIRRVTFDLTGLPPTPDDIDAFLADASPDAFSKVVDRLLASPAYGERWGRHWLDVARYADSNGLDENTSFGNAWKYRDYVIRSFNADKPFDVFVREQVAGDLLPPTDDPAVRTDAPHRRSGVLAEATGFEGTDVAHANGPSWVRYGGSLVGFVDVTGTARVVSLAVTARFADPLGKASPSPTNDATPTGYQNIPFTELVSIGGTELMRGYLPGRLLGRSALVGSLHYSWPVGTSFAGALRADVGNVFDAHLEDFRFERLRFSSALGFETPTSVQGGFEVLVGVGSEPFDRGGKIESFRLAFGSNRGF